MKVVSVHEAKTHLSRLLKDVSAGEDVVIARGKKPVARLVRVMSSEDRVFGQDRNLIVIAPDFDEPLDDFENYR